MYYFLDHGDLIDAAKEGNLEKVRRLIQNGANVHERDSELQATPLHWASYNGHLDVAQFLIQNGADVKARKKNQETPLHIACL